MKDVNGVEVTIGAKVYDLSVEKDAENYGPPDTVVSISYPVSNQAVVWLDNGKFVVWKGPGYYVGLAVETEELKERIGLK